MFKWLKRLLTETPAEAKKILWREPVFKENEIPLARLSDIAEEKPVGIVCQDGTLIGIYREHKTLYVQNMRTLKFIHWEIGSNLVGVIEIVKDKFGLTDECYTFNGADSREQLVKWADNRKRG